MSLAGRGAVAIWHDIAPDARAEFYRWHGREHMPERLDIPGFVRGRRYVALDGDPEFFNLYETKSPFILTGPDYLARLDNPTPWTVATVKHFTHVVRSLCRIAASCGEAQGGVMATYRYDVGDDRAAQHRQEMTLQKLPMIAEMPGVAGCHLLIADAAASAVETTEKKVRVERNAVAEWILLIEGWGDNAPFSELCRRLIDDGLFAEASFAPALGIYRLQTSRAGALSAG